MRARLILVAALVAGTLAVASSSSQAGHHLWRLSRLFSNADGSVQYAQLFVTEANEAGVGPFTLTASGHTFNFATNLPCATFPTCATANTWILLATSNFASLPGGVTPDYIIPAGFFTTGGGSMVYANTVDTWNYGTVPTDGKHALMRDGSTPLNKATNFAGQTGSLVVGPGVPAVTGWGLALLVGALLLAASGLLRRGVGRPRRAV